MPPVHRFVAAEILFDPTEVMHGAPAGGLPELVLAAIDDVVAAEGGETPEERRKLRGELLGRVVLSGGTSAMAGLRGRLGTVRAETPIKSGSDDDDDDSPVKMPAQTPGDDSDSDA